MIFLRGALALALSVTVACAINVLLVTLGGVNVITVVAAIAVAVTCGWNTKRVFLPVANWMVSWPPKAGDSDAPTTSRR